MIAQPEPQQSYMPEIKKKSQTLARGAKVEDILFTDAARRQEKKRINIQEEQKKIIPEEVPEAVSENSKKRIYKKFMDDFEDACEAQQEEEGSVPKDLGQVYFVQMLSSIGFLNNPQLEAPLID